jgi:predicted methyltransferase
MKTRLIALVLLAFAATLFACAPAAEDSGSTETPAAEAQDAVESEGGGHDHPMDVDDRDAWSKPDEVYAFLGIGSGDRVVDLLAGGGYNAVRLAELVGPEGRVVAERGSEELQARLADDGDLAAVDNLDVVADLGQVEDGSMTHVVAVRAYHLFPDVPAVLAELFRVLEPGGTVGIVEVRLNQPEGHDMETHRMGEQTVISDMEAAGFEFVEESDLLRIEDDDYSLYMPADGTRYMTDRMLLKFRKPQ